MFNRDAYCQRYFLRKEAASLGILAKPFKWVGSKMGLSSLDNGKAIGTTVENASKPAAAAENVGTTVENASKPAAAAENVGTTVENAGKPVAETAETATGNTPAQQPKEQYGALKTFWGGLKAIGTMGAGGAIMAASGAIGDH